MREEKVYRCRLTQNFKSPKKIMNGKKLAFKQFIEGAEVVGSRFNQSDTHINYAPVFKTTDGYIIPQSYLQVLGEERAMKNEVLQDAVIVNDNDYVSKSSIENVKKASSNMSGSTLVESAKLKSKYAINGAMVGGAIGVIYALMKRQNKLVLGGIGIVLGGVVGNMYNNFKTNK